MNKESSVAKLGLDTAENEPFKFRQKFVPSECGVPETQVTTAAPGGIAGTGITAFLDELSFVQVQEVVGFTPFLPLFDAFCSGCCQPWTAAIR